jgi:hypothetical protein
LSTEAYSAARGRILNAAARRIPAASAASQARALGLWDGKEVRFGTEAQFGLLLDLGVFGPVGGHSRALEREARQPHDAEEARVLAALAAAHFTLFRLGEARPEGGVRAEDLLRGTALHLRDNLLERPEFEGCAFAGRLMRLDGMEMTCGAAAPMTDAVIGTLLGRAVPMLPAPGHAACADAPRCRGCGCAGGRDGAPDFAGGFTPSSTTDCSAQGPIDAAGPAGRLLAR